jgi:hypothetical protein
MTLLSLSDPVTTTISAVSQAIVSICNLTTVMVQNQTPEEIQRITQDMIDLLAPFNSIIKKLDSKLKIDVGGSENLPPGTK